MRGSGRKLLLWSSLVLSLLLAGRLLVERGFRLSAHVAGNGDDLISRSRLNAQQDAPTGAPAYAAGTYMAGRRPGNRSHCKWYYNLPDILSYPPSKVTWSPGIGEKSPYRVLPFVLRGVEVKDDMPQVTLCTHATADQVYGIVELARRWEGPLSLAIFVPGLDAGLAVALLDRACRCETAMYKVSLSYRRNDSFLEAYNSHRNFAEVYAATFKRDY